MVRVVNRFGDGGKTGRNVTVRRRSPEWTSELSGSDYVRADGSRASRVFTVRSGEAKENKDERDRKMLTEAMNEGKGTVIEAALNLANKGTFGNLIYTPIAGWRAGKGAKEIFRDMWGVDDTSKWGSDVFMTKAQRERHPVVAIGVDMVSDPEGLITAVKSPGLAVASFIANEVERNIRNRYIHKDTGTK